jgi:CPA1 family monovalent cation:H+ antiporter
MDATIVVLLSLVAVVISGLLARVSRLPVPLVQMALGAAIHYSGLYTVVLDPEVFFLLFLPPLLFLDGWRIPNESLVRDAATILKLALGLVLFTVLGMGLFIHWLIPTMPLAVAFALAAVISPTDPIAVSTLAKTSPIPRRLMHILQGEALLNDASGLVCMRFAVAAALTGSFSFGAALASFAGLAVGGLAIGAGTTWLVARCAAWAADRWGEDGGAQILVTLLIPFGVYLLAEQLHVSGILAAVAAGITMSFTDLWPWRASTRLRRTAVWDLVQLAANGSIFVLLGEQLPALLQTAPLTALEAVRPNPWWLLLDVVLIVGALAALRFVWVWASLEIRFLGARRRGEPLPFSGWRVVMVTSLAGVRGAVTLAGVMTLPLTLGDGSPFPGRDLAILLAAGVIVLWLLLASAALPATLRGLSLPPEPTHKAAENKARIAAAEAAVLAVQAAEIELQPGRADARRCAEARARVIDLYRQRIERWEGHQTLASKVAEDRIERALHLVGLRAERSELLRHGREFGIEELVLRRIVRELDHLEVRYGG